MSEIPVRVEITNYIAVVTLHRPPVNALNLEMREQLTRTFDAFTDRKDVRVAILTGEGHVFSAGADLKDRPKLDEAGSFGNHNRIVRETANSIRDCAKPVIAAINGAAVGAGMSIALACDIVLASDNAFFTMPEINVGLAGGAALLHEFFGRSRMRRMLFTGMRISAAELYRLGVIEASVPKEELLSEALKIANEIASKNPLGIQYAKQSANMVALMSPRDAYRLEQNFTVELSKTQNSEEARRAFFEKRQAKFKDE